jgi:glycosyltransferase involved in cell wall biosynthesis
LEAYSAYRRKGGKRNLEIAGHGPLENSLKAFALENDLASCVKFCGLQAYSVLPELYARAGCLILPSNSEMWGLVVNEAMASGLPVIVSDHCGCVDDLVKDAVNGFIFPASNSEALMDRMLAIDALDEPAREAMGRKSQQIIARLSPESWAEAVLRLAQGQSSCSAAA